MKNVETFSYYIQTFLDHYVIGERGLSENTLISYDHALGQMAEYMFKQHNNRNKKVTMADLTAENVVKFLDHLEKEGLSVSTRNQRLAVIRSFCKYIRFKSPRHLHSIDQILAIPRKKGNVPAVQYLCIGQLEKLLNKPNRKRE